MEREEVWEWMSADVPTGFWPRSRSKRRTRRDERYPFINVPYDVSTT
jgi:hypothetical protein